MPQKSRGGIIIITHYEYTDNTWSDWSPWSPCSASCDTGLKTRTRYCTQFGGICTGHSVETDFCGRTICLGMYTSSTPEMNLTEAFLVFFLSTEDSVLT